MKDQWPIAPANAGSPSLGVLGTTGPAWLRSSLGMNMSMQALLISGIGREKAQETQKI